MIKTSETRTSRWKHAGLASWFTRRPHLRAASEAHLSSTSSGVLLAELDRLGCGCWRVDARAPHALGGGGASVRAWVRSSCHHAKRRKRPRCGGLLMVKGGWSLLQSLLVLVLVLLLFGSGGGSGDGDGVIIVYRLHPSN